MRYLEITTDISPAAWALRTHIFTLFPHPGASVPHFHACTAHSNTSHTWTSPHLTRAYLHTCTSPHAHTRTLPHFHICTTFHFHTSTSAHLLTSTSPRLHALRHPTPAQLLTFTPPHLHTFLTSRRRPHFHTFTHYFQT